MVVHDTRKKQRKYRPNVGGDLSRYRTCALPRQVVLVMHKISNRQTQEQFEFVPFGSPPFPLPHPLPRFYSRHGRCEKPGCTCTKAKAGRSKHLGFKMCECGHAFDAHALITGVSKPAQRPGRNHRSWVLPQKQVRAVLLVCLFRFSGLVSLPNLFLVKTFPVVHVLERQGRLGLVVPRLWSQIPIAKILPSIARSNETTYSRGELHPPVDVYIYIYIYTWMWS